MKEQITNYPAIAVATLISMIIPAVWYMIFADPWMEGNGISQESVEQGHSPYPYLIAMVSSFVGAMALSYLNIKLDGNTFMKGALIGLFVGLAFCFIPMFTQNSFSMRPNSLSFVDGGVNLVNWMVVGGLLGAWKKYREE